MESGSKSNQDVDGGRVRGMVKRWGVLMQDLTPRIVRDRLRWIVGGILVVVAFIWMTTADRSVSGSLPSNAPTIGELGGVPVSIPKPYANFVEYDGDPYWLEPRKGPAPTRTYQSKLASFGFDIHFPDMQVLTLQNAEAKRKEGIYRSKWIFVGVNSNSMYRGGAILNSYVKNLDKPGQYRYPFQRLAEKRYGLVVNTPIGVDISKRHALSQVRDIDDNTIYLDEDGHGDVTTFIVCSNVEHAAASCTMHFTMWPEVRAKVTASFAIGLLPQWNEMRTLLRRELLSFVVSSSAEIHRENSGAKASD